MGLRIGSLSSRDQVDIQRPSQPRTQLLDTPDPIPSNVGKGLKQYANFVAQKEAEAATNARNIRRANIKNKFADFETDATSQVMQAQGENTFTATDVAGKKLKSDLDKALQSTPLEFQAEYKNYANDTIQRFNKTSQGRMLSEGRKAGEEAFKKRSNDLTGRAVLNAYDDNEFEVALQELDSTVEENMKLTVGDQSPRALELMDIHKKEAKSTAIFKTAQTLAASGDVDKAREIAQKYKNDLTAADTRGMYKLLAEGKQKRDLDTAKSVADSIYATYGDDEVSAYQAISQSTTDGQLARDIQTNYSARAAAERRGNDRKRKETFGDVQTQIIKTGQFTTEMRMKLDPQDARAAQELYVKVSRGELIPRNNAVWNRMLNMYVEEPSRFQMQTFTDLQHQLPNTDMNTLIRLRDKLTDPLSTKFTPKGSSWILNKYKRQITAPSGSRRRMEEEAAVTDAYVNAFNNAQANLGERGSQQEIDKAIEEEMSVTTLKMKDNRSILDKILFRPVDMRPQPSPSQKGSQRINSQATPPAITNYNASDVAKVSAHLQNKMKRKPTTPEVLRALSHLRDQGKIIEKP